MACKNNKSYENNQVLYTVFFLGTHMFAYLILYYEMKYLYRFGDDVVKIHTKPLIKYL